MTDRLNKIFREIPVCRIFADVGCDHGYIAKAMLSSEKCQRVIISDISAKCLEKAEVLLAKEINEGRAFSVVSDGFEKVGKCDCALIAGMGGEEIVSILNSAKNLPDTLVLQPMKNCEKVRLCVLQLGYHFKRDFVFKSAGKFYDLIVLVKGGDELTEEQIEFGKDNVLTRPKAFIELMKITFDKLMGYVNNDNLSQISREEVLRKADKIKKYVED